MSGEIPERVVCEVCGTSFDPRESRGWCPNEACGKWQHPAFPLSAGGGREAADGGVNAPTKVCPSCGKDVRADANFCKFCSHEFPDEPAEPQGGDDEPGLDACPDCGADLSSIPPDRLADCPICGTDLSDVLADQSEPEVTPADLTNCPACSADLTNIPADMRMVCPDCRVDLQEAIRTHGVGDDGGAAGTQQAGGGQTAAGGGQGTGAGGGAGAGGAGAGQAGGSGAAGGGAGGESDAAAESVDTVKGIGASYADRLANAGVETVGDLVRADLTQLSAATDISEKRLGEWVERAPVDSADVSGGQGGGQQPGQAGQQAGQAGSRQGQADQQGGQAGGQQGGRAGGQQGGRAGQTGGQQGGQAGQAGGRQSGGAGQAGGQQGGQGGRQQGGQAGQGGQTGGRQGSGQQGGQAGQAGGRQGSDQSGGRQGGQGRRASSGGGAGAGGSGGRQGGRDQPSVPGSSSGGQGGAGRAGGRQGRPSYSTVVFDVMGQEVRANPGETVGREIRTAMVEGGAPDDDAVYVHREHLRVDREGDTFYLVRLGQNSLKVNGTPVGQHERIEVSNGDEVSFSEVVTADVRLE